jgi:hypothetical protein
VIRVHRDRLDLLEVAVLVELLLSQAPRAIQAHRDLLDQKDLEVLRGSKVLLVLRVSKVLLDLRVIQVHRDRLESVVLLESVV